MRSIVLQRSRKGIAKVFKLGFLGLIMMTVGTGQALAQAPAKSCNPDLDFRINQPGPYFLGDEMPVLANLGARDIDAGNYMDIESFGFALNCHDDEDFHSCTDAGNKVEFLGQPITNCLNAEGDPATLLVPQRNIIPIRVQGPPIRTPKNSQCEVAFKMSVTDLARDDEGNITNNRVVQAMGWPIEGGDPAMCDNGLTSAATSTIAYDVQTCGIEVEKQVSIDQTNWFDADSPETAINVGNIDTAYYRLIVKNTSSVDYIGDMQITDQKLGFAGTVDGLEAGEEVTLGGEGSGFDVDALCAELGEGEFTFWNEAQVDGVCRTDAHPLGEVLASGLDRAYINCKPYNIRSLPAVRIEKSTNGEDADTAPGPTVDPGSTVTWDYVVYNEGQQPLFLDSITDNLEGDVTCEKDYLGISEFTNCTAKTGTAVVGQYANIATVQATAAGNGQQVSDTDPSHYYGQGRAPVIEVAKSVESLDTNDDGSVDVTYKVTVSNTGNAEGVYDLVDTLMINSAFTPSLIVSNVAYLAGTEDSRTGALQTPELADYSTGATLVTGETLAAGLNESFVFTLRFAVNMGTITPEGANCIADDNDGNTGLTNHVDVKVGGEIVDWAEACGGITLQPSIAVLKEVWDGSGWADANDVDSAPYQYYPSDAEYRITVENTGRVNLENVTITDAKLGLDGVKVNDGGTLAVGAKVVLTKGQMGALLKLDACSESGPYENIVTANGNGTVNSIPVEATDNAIVNCVGRPDILVKKYISIDEGVTWHDAGIPELQNPPLPYIDPADPVPVDSGAEYKITVKNTGQVDLVNVTISDPFISATPYALGGGNGPDEVDLTAGQEVTLVKGDWAALDQELVCSTSGIFQNVATAAGTSAEWDTDSDTDTDDAFLECIGDPRIKITKEVSVDDGVSWHDANTAPFPTALVDDAPVALYRITVENLDSEVTLYNVVINDVKLELVDYEVGTLAPLAKVIITPVGYGGGVEDDDFMESDICPNTGEKTNTASATGTSDAGESDTSSDHATVDCIGSPEIRVVKTVSRDGINFYDANTPEAAVKSLAPAKAWYRIEVTNIGNEDLVNVSITDEDLDIYDFVPTGIDGAGKLRKGETVVIAHADAGDNTVTALYDPEVCLTAGEPFENIVVVVSDSAESSAQPTDDDNAWFDCDQPVDICSDEGAGGRPSAIYLEYNGTPTGVNIQNAVGTFETGYSDYSQVTTVNVSDGKGAGEDFVYAPGLIVNLDGSFTSTGKADKIPPNIRLEFLTAGGDLVQWIEFHGSCSLPLHIGDQYAGMTLIGYKP